MDIVVTGDNNTQAIVTPAVPLAITVDGALRGPQGLQGIQGIQGLVGPDGATGSRWYEGIGAPGITQNNGDYYLDTNAGDVYEQISNAWSKIGNIKGPQGAAGSGGDMLLATTQTITGAKSFALNTLLDKGSMVYNVRAYGAVGDGTTDDTVAIQATINAANAVGGGIVLIPMGTYKITTALTSYARIFIVGNGVGVSVIKQTTNNINAFSLVDGIFAGFENLQITNSGTHTAGIGIDLTWSLNGNVEQMYLQNLQIVDFHIGVNAQTLITSQISNVECLTCDTGFYFYQGGTSTSVNNTYANGCGVGYYVDGLVYISFNGTAADSSHQAYYLHNCGGITFNGCGCESGVKTTAPNDGRGWFIDSCVGLTFNACWNYANPSYAFYATNSSSLMLNNFTENGPVVGATNGIFIDTNCARITVVSPNTVSTNNLESGSAIVTVISDSGGNTTLPGAVKTGHLTSPVTVNGTNGNMILNANTDGGQYNLNVDTTGVLAIFGSSTATLNVALLDGYLEVDTLTATTVPYIDGNHRFASSTVTPTQLGYLGGATGTSGTGNLLFGTSPAVSGLSGSTSNLQMYGALTMEGYAINITGVAATNRDIFLQTAGSNRIEIGASNTVESGLNVGSDLYINTYTDAGAYLGTPFVLTRSSGLLSLNSGLSVGSGLTVTSGSIGVTSGNLTLTSGNLILTSGYMTISGTSGTLEILANTDGGDFNIFTASGTKTLAFYGSAAAVLNINLYDGALYMGSNLTISNTGVHTNSTFDTAATGNVFKINGTSITGVTGTGAVVLATVASLSSLTTVGTITSGGLGTGAVIGGVTMTLGSDATGDIYYRAAGGVLTRLAVGTSSQVLIGGTTPSWGAPFALTTTGTSGAATFSGGTLNIPNYASGGMSNPMTTLGDIIYENATPAAARLAGNTTTAKQYLSQTGNGTISAAPAWATIAAADLSNGVQGSGAVVLANTPTLTTPRSRRSYSHFN